MAQYSFMISKLRFNLWQIVTGLTAALAAIPIFTILWYLPAGGLESWDHIWQNTLPPYLINTALLMVMVGILSAAIGVTSAWLVVAMDFPGRRLLSWLLILPLAAPAYIIAYVYTDFLAFSGPVQTALRSSFGLAFGEYWFPQIRSLPGAALMLSLVLYPYVYLLARTAFATQSLNQYQAARSLGAGPTQAFFRIVLPCARPAIAGGLALVLMETLADFGVAEYFAIPTFSTGIFRTWLAMGDKAAAMKLAAIMLLFVIILLWMESASRKGRVENSDGFSSVKNDRKLGLGGSILAISICSFPVIFGFLLPATILLNYTIESGDPQGWEILSGYIFNSLSLSMIVSAIAVGLAILLVYAQRRASTSKTKAGIRIATLGYALPGALLAVGLLAPLGQFDQFLTGWAQEQLGYGGGLLLTGTSAILIYALVVRFLTVSFNSVNGGMARIPLSMDAAARSLGASPKRVVGAIHLPQLRASLAAGGALVFVDVLRELPATLILRPFNLETLATRVYRLASDERIAEASTSALLIVATGLIPVLILNQIGKGAERENS